MTPRGDHLDPETVKFWHSLNNITAAIQIYTKEWFISSDKPIQIQLLVDKSLGVVQITQIFINKENYNFAV